MIDRYVYGQTESISFEAPIPIIKVEKTDQKIGGAGTVVENSINLGSKVSVIGFVGNDESGKWLLNKFNKLKVTHSSIILHKNSNSFVRTRIFANNYHVCRYDDYPKKISENLYTKFKQNIITTIPKVDGIVVIDYGINTITPDIIKLISEHSKKHKKKVIISSLNHDNYRDESFIYRITIKDAQKLLQVKNINNFDTLKICKKLESILKSKKIILTRGRLGLTAYDGEKADDIAATQHKARDTNSVGDILIAVFANFYFSGKSFYESCEIANVAAGITVEKIGAKSLSKTELYEELKYFQDFEFEK